MSSRSGSSSWRLIEQTSPWLTVAALVLLAWWLPNRTTFSPEAEAHKARVAAAMQSVPFFINHRWIDQIPREAQELLRPNAILSRAYSSQGGPVVHVLMTHCGDARDMIGHFPPICYPSSGWIQRTVPHGGDHTLNAGAYALPVREYVFSRPRDRMREDVIRVFNAFILPDGRVTPRIEEINRQSERLAVSLQGVAQLQIIMLASVPLPEALEAAEELMAGMTNLLDALHVSKEPLNETMGTF
jgi:hypothetical protein